MVWKPRSWLVPDIHSPGPDKPFSSRSWIEGPLSFMLLRQMVDASNVQRAELTTEDFALQARGKIAAAKVLAPSTVLSVLDAAIQAHGGAGVSDDVPLARLWAGARTLRIADGPDDVHLISIAKLELSHRRSKL